MCKINNLCVILKKIICKNKILKSKSNKDNKNNKIKNV